MLVVPGEDEADTDTPTQGLQGVETPTGGTMGRDVGRTRQGGEARRTQQGGTSREALRAPKGGPPHTALSTGYPSGEADDAERGAANNDATDGRMGVGRRGRGRRGRRAREGGGRLRGEGGGEHMSKELGTGGAGGAPNAPRARRPGGEPRYMTTRP